MLVIDCERWHHDYRFTSAIFSYVQETQKDVVFLHYTREVAFITWEVQHPLVIQSKANERRRIMDSHRTEVAGENGSSSTLGCNME